MRASRFAIPSSAEICCNRVSSAIFWPEIALSSDMNLKAEFTTTNNGSMYSTWIGGALGRGCNRLVIDDPHSANAAYSDAERESAVRFIRGSLFSRLDNPGRDAIVIAHARVHEDDITGVLLDPDRGNDTPRPKVEEATSEPPSETAMDATVASEPYWGPLRYNPWICGYTR